MNDKISSNQMCAITYFLIRAAFAGMTTRNIVIILRQDSIIGIIIGFLLGFVNLFLFFQIMNYEPSLTLPNKIIKLFGNFWGKIINVTVFILFFIFILSNFWNLTYFISSQYLHKTPTIIISSMLLIASIYILFKPFKVLARTSFVLLYFSIILVLISSLGLVFQIDVDNLKPFFLSGWHKFFIGGRDFFCFNTMPILLLTIVPKESIIDYNKLKKRLVFTYLITCIIMVFVMLIITSVFGPKLALLYQYPEFHLLKQVSILGFNTRLESILALQWIYDVFILVTLGVFFLKQFVSSTIKIDHNFIFVILILLLLVLEHYLFQDTTKIYNFIIDLLPMIMLVLFAIFFIIAILFQLKKKGQ